MNYLVYKMSSGETVTISSSVCSCLVLYDQQYKPKKYSVYNNPKQRKAINLHIKEVENVKCSLLDKMTLMIK